MNVKEIQTNLVGKRCLSLHVSVDYTSMALVFDGSTVFIDTEQDCCSETWFADVIGVDCLLSGYIVYISEKDLSPSEYNVNDGRDRQEEDKAYCVTIVTTGGHCDMVFRNSSNGYYGGSVTYTVDIDSRRPTESYARIVDDWKS